MTGQGGWSTCAQDDVALGSGALSFGLPVPAHLRQVVPPAAAGLAECLGLARSVVACAQAADSALPAYHLCRCHQPALQAMLEVYRLIWPFIAWMLTTCPAKYAIVGAHHQSLTTPVVTCDAETAEDAKSCICWAHSCRANMPLHIIPQTRMR